MSNIHETQPILPIFGEETVWYDRERAVDQDAEAYEATRTQVVSVNEIDALSDQLLRSALWRQFSMRTAPSSSPLSRKKLVVKATADDFLRSWMPVRKEPFSLSENPLVEVDFETDNVDVTSPEQ
ncbi:MAG: hypothetical protein ABIR37_02985 [Candidatus Saccharimonadales bacterium]